jgi:DNA-binding MarR family transcriptional regulator
MSSEIDLADAPLPGAAPRLPRALSDRVGYLIARCHHATHSLATEAIAPLGLTIKHFGCLSVIADEGPLSQQRLGVVMGVDRTTMVAVVDDLAAKRLVARRRNPIDRRAYALEATPAGLRWLARASGYVREAEAKLLAGLTPAQRAELSALLTSLIHNAEAARST